MRTVALLMLLLMLSAPLAPVIAASPNPGESLDESANGFSSVAKSAVDKALILVGLRGPPLEPLGSEYADSLRELSRTLNRVGGVAESFDRLLEQANKRLEMGDFVGASVALNFTVEVAAQIRDDLADADKEFRGEGGEVTRKLERSKKRLPPGKLDKHRDAVAEITKENKELSTEFSDLFVLLRETRDAIDANNTATAQQKIGEVRTQLAGLKSKSGEITAHPKTKVSVPKELPTRPSKGEKTKPRVSYPKETPKLRTVNNPTVAVEKSLLGRIADKIIDLVPDVFAEEVVVGNVTYDIPTEIVELAGQLDNNPAKIYAYVRDEVEYVPYYGFMKGSLWTLWEGAANDMDQAALLSDLLRASGYETRFVVGTVEVEPGYMKLVLGVNTTEEALQLLWENGVPAEFIGGKKILVEHAWVEARIPYGMYSGDCYRGYIASRDACGGAPEVWVPLDSSFTPYKPKRPYPIPSIDYNLTGVFLQTLENGTYGEDYFTGLNFSALDLAAEELVNLSDEWYAENVGSVLENMTDEEVEALYADRPPDIKPDIIPGTTPFSPLVFETYSEIPDDYLHMINIRVVENSEDILSFNIPSHMTVGVQLTLDYVPADEAIADLVNSQESLTDIPAYLLDYRPILLLNGIIVAVGEKSTFGTNQELLVTITTPAQQETVSSPLTVGDYYGLAFDLGDMPAENAEKVFQRTLLGLVEDGTMVMDHSVGGYMSLSLLNYYAMTDMNYETLADAMGLRWWRSSPSVAVFGYTFETTYSASVPVNIDPSFARIDVARNVLSLQGDREVERAFALLAGGISSSWESTAFDLNYDTMGISTVDAFEAAVSQGVRIHRVNPINVESLDQLSLPANVKESIRASVGQGYEVFVPERQLNIGNWTGLGWLVVDPATGASAWMIGDELGTVVHGATGDAQSDKEYYEPRQPNSVSNYVPPLTEQEPRPGYNPPPTETQGTWEKRTSKLNSYSSTIGGKTYTNKVPDTTLPYEELGMGVADFMVAASEYRSSSLSAAKMGEYLSERGKAGAFKTWANRFGDTAKGEEYLSKFETSSGAAKSAYSEAKSLSSFSSKAKTVSKGLGALAVGITTIEAGINVINDYQKGNYINAGISLGTGLIKIGVVAAFATATAPGLVGVAAIIGASYVATKVIDKGTEVLKARFGEG